MQTTLAVGPDARLNWLPQEMILYEGCALERRLEVSLAPTAQFLMVEPLVFGRIAMQEHLHSGHFKDRVAITRQQRPIYLDGVDLCGDIARLLARPAVANGAGAMATAVFVGADAARPPFCNSRPVAPDRWRKPYRLRCAGPATAGQ